MLSVKTKEIAEGLHERGKISGTGQIDVQLLLRGREKEGGQGNSSRPSTRKITRRQRFWESVGTPLAGRYPSRPTSRHSSLTGNARPRLFGQAKAVWYWSQFTGHLVLQDLVDKSFEIKESFWTT